MHNIIIVTRGSEDTILGQNGKILIGKTEQVSVVNPIGSGDAFNGGFLYAFSQNQGLENALEMGIYAASRNVESMAPGNILEIR